MKDQYKPELFISHEVEGKNVSLFREYQYGGGYKYFINWGDHPQGPIIDEDTMLKTPKGYNVTIVGAIKQFKEAIEASKHVTFNKI